MAKGVKREEKYPKLQHWFQLLSVAFTLITDNSSPGVTGTQLFLFLSASILTSKNLQKERNSKTRDKSFHMGFNECLSS